MGETDDEVRAAIADLRAVGVEILTIGQYLRPSAEHLPVVEVVAPRRVRRAARRTASRSGFAHVESGPLVRSSYHAREGADRLVCARRTEIMGAWPSASRRCAPTWRSGGASSRCSSSPTAPSGDDGHVNLSPKGYDTLRVLGADRVAYLDLTGSGVETIAHLRDNGRITLMACAFSGNPRISRIYGTRHRARGRLAGVRRARAELPRSARAGGRSSTSRSSGSRRRAATRCRSWISSTIATACSTGREPRATTGSSSTGTSKNAREHRRPAGDRARDAIAAADRARARTRMDELGVDVLLLSVGPDLPYLTGYEAMPLERLTMLVLPRDRRRAARRARGSRRRASTPRPELFEHRAVGGDRRPDRARRAVIRRSARAASRSATTPGRASCSTSSTRCRRASFVRATEVVGADPHGEGRRRDRGAARAPRTRSTRSRSRCACGPFAGRTELDVHRELVERMLAARPRACRTSRSSRPASNAASPHHEPTATRVIARRRHRALRLRRHDATATAPTSRACSTSASRRPRSATSTRCSSRRRRRACAPATVGTPCEEVDAAARARDRRRRASASYFVHRVGHGIGTEAHEDPVHGRGQRAAARRRATRSASSRASTSPAGSACGSRTSSSRPTDGPLRLNDAPRDLAIVGAREARRARPSCCSGPPAGCCSAGSRRAAARSASATAG